MKTLIATLSLLLSLDAIGAGVQWNNYPTTNSVPGTATILIGNGSTNLTATATIFGTTQTQPLINTSSNLLYANAITAINSSSNLVYANAITAINTSSNLIYLNAITAINTSSNSIVTNLPPRANYPALTNSVTGLARQTLLSQAHLDTNGSPAATWTNMLTSDLEFHVATNAFTNVVVGYIGPLTNYDGFKFYIPIGTNMP